MARSVRTARAWLSSASAIVVGRNDLTTILMVALVDSNVTLVGVLNYESDTSHVPSPPYSVNEFNERSLKWFRVLCASQRFKQADKVYNG